MSELCGLCLPEPPSGPSSALSWFSVAHARSQPYWPHTAHSPPLLLHSAVLCTIKQATKRQQWWQQQVFCLVVVLQQCIFFHCNTMRNRVIIHFVLGLCAFSNYHSICTEDVCGHFHSSERNPAPDRFECTLSWSPMEKLSMGFSSFQPIPAGAALFQCNSGSVVLAYFIILQMTLCSEKITL